MILPMYWATGQHRHPHKSYTNGILTQRVLYSPLTVALYCGGASSITNIGAAVVANVQKKDNKKRPPTKVGRSFAVAVMTVPTNTPTQPAKIGTLRPFQSAIQT